MYVNPVGRIMNRFSKDISCMDDVLSTQNVSESNPKDLADVHLNTSTNCHQPLASVCSYANSCVSGSYFKILLKDVKGAAKAGVS